MFLTKKNIFFFLFFFELEIFLVRIYHCFVTQKTNFCSHFFFDKDLRCFLSKTIGSMKTITSTVTEHRKSTGSQKMLLCNAWGGWAMRRTIMAPVALTREVSCQNTVNRPLPSGSGAISCRWTMAAFAKTRLFNGVLCSSGWGGSDHRCTFGGKQI